MTERIRSPFLPSVQVKCSFERIQIALTLLHLSAVTTKAESEWITGLVMSNMDKRPVVQEMGYGA